MRIKVVVTGAEEVRASLRRVGKAGQEAAKKVLGDYAKKILAKAKPLTPVDPEDGGQLRDSGRTTKPTVTRAGNVSAGIVFGGAPLKRVMGKRRLNVYAIVQHEDLTLKHTTGQAKFLEQPFFQIAPEVPNAVLAELDRLTAGEGVG